MAVIRRKHESESMPMVEGVTMKMVIGPDQGAPFFNLRIFEIDPGARTPHHSHWWEHEIFILEGQTALQTEAGEVLLGKGDAAFIPGDEMHQFINIGQETLRFICLIPQEWLGNVSEKPANHLC